METRIERRPSRIKIHAQAAFPPTPLWNNELAKTLLRVVIVKAYHLCDTSREDASKSSSKGSRRKEQCHAEATFVPDIPLRDIVIDAWEKATFEDTKKHSCCHQAGVIGDEALADHRQRPEEHNECKPNGWPDALHHHVRWYLGGNVEGKQNGETVIVLYALEL